MIAAKTRAVNRGFDPFLSSPALVSPFQRTTSLYGSLTDLLAGDDLEPAMRGVGGILALEGFILYETNTEWALTSSWNHHTFSVDHDDLATVALIGSVGRGGFCRW